MYETSPTSTGLVWNTNITTILLVLNANMTVPLLYCSETFVKAKPQRQSIEGQPDL